MEEGEAAVATLILVAAEVAATGMRFILGLRVGALASRVVAVVRKLANGHCSLQEKPQASKCPHSAQRLEHVQPGQR